MVAYCVCLAVIDTLVSRFAPAFPTLATETCVHRHQEMDEADERALSMFMPSTSSSQQRTLADLIM